MSTGSGETNAQIVQRSSGWYEITADYNIYTIRDLDGEGWWIFKGDHTYPWRQTLGKAGDLESAFFAVAFLLGDLTMLKDPTVIEMLVANHLRASDE